MDLHWQGSVLVRMTEAAPVGAARDAIITRRGKEGRCIAKAAATVMPSYQAVREVGSGSCGS